MNVNSDALDWGKGNGLVPAVVQDAVSLRVLMMAYVNREALEKTLSSGFATFFSRSRQCLWQKGETSGHVLKIVDIKVDCDNDTLLMMVEPHGPTCHTGALTCFGNPDDKADLAVLADLAATIRDRKNNPSGASYTAKLFADGLPRIAQKVGEEGVESALAAVTKDGKLPEEAADLVYHLLVLLEASGFSLFDVLNVLHQRAHRKGSQ